MILLVVLVLAVVLAVVVVLVEAERTAMKSCLGQHDDVDKDPQLICIVILPVVLPVPVLEPPVHDDNDEDDPCSKRNKTTRR